MDSHYPTLDQPIYDEMHGPFLVGIEWGSLKTKVIAQKKRHALYLIERAEKERIQEMIANHEARNLFSKFKEQ
jgi:hypothetical protein